MTPEEKHRKEMDAFRDLVQKLPGYICSDLFTAFKRYEDQKTADMDARLCKDFDKFDMILQAFEYEKKARKGKYLQQFFDSTMAVFESAPVKKWHTTLLRIRDSHFES